MQQNRLRRTIFGIALAVGCIVADPLPQVRPGAGSDLASAWTCGPSSASASELQADWNGQFVHLFLPGTFTEYSIWRADGGSAEFRMLDYSQVGCTEACVYDDLGLQFGESFDYQIKVLLPDGTVATFGPVNVQIDPTRGRSLDSRMAPNPAVGPTSLQGVKVRNVQTSETRVIDCRGLFYAIGHIPNTAFLGGQIAVDETGYILTKPGTTQTSVVGVFAAGDVQDKRWRQAITAAGMGCMAALEAEAFLAGH